MQELNFSNHTAIAFFLFQSHCEHHCPPFSLLKKTLFLKGKKNKATIPCKTGYGSKYTNSMKAVGGEVFSKRDN